MIFAGNSRRTTGIEEATDEDLRKKMSSTTTKYEEKDV